MEKQHCYHLRSGTKKVRRWEGVKECGSDCAPRAVAVWNKRKGSKESGGKKD
jgi:hypothetical protein